MDRRIKIECLFAPGCAARDETLAMVNRIIDERGFSAEVREIVITSPEEAAKYHFLGSPSLRVNGRDVEPGADERTDFGMG